MKASKRKILKNALSYLQMHDGLSYDRALIKISGIIISGDTENNPLFGHLLEAALPSDPQQLHELLMPGAIHA
jgi:hypothetical protein